MGHYENRPCRRDEGGATVKRLIASAAVGIIAWALFVAFLILLEWSGGWNFDRDIRANGIVFFGGLFGLPIAGGSTFGAWKLLEYIARQPDKKEVPQ